MQPPSYDDILAARSRVYAHMRPSPLLHHPLLDEWIGCRTLVKHENHNPTGAFKVRGGLNLAAQLSDDERRRGVISASTGNHGQSIALACRIFNVHCRVVVPVGNNPDKNAAMRAFGAEVIEQGRDFDDAREYVEGLVARDGVRYVHSANEPQLIAGVGTCALEIFDECADVDYIFVPIGGGTGACGCGLVRSARDARAKVIGVQAAGADAFTRSWRSGTAVTTERAHTFAEGIATRCAYELPLRILADELDDVVTLSEDELRAGMVAALRCTHNLAEPSGSASLAAARQYGASLAGKTAVCIMTGGNVAVQTVSEVLALAEGEFSGHH